MGARPRKHCHIIIIRTQKAWMHVYVVCMCLKLLATSKLKLSYIMYRNVNRCLPSRFVPESKNSRTMALLYDWEKSTMTDDSISLIGQSRKIPVFSRIAEK